MTVWLRQVSPGLPGGTGSLRPTGGKHPRPARGQRSRALLCGWLQVTPQDSVAGPLLGFIVCCHLEVAIGALGKLRTWSALTR